MQTNDFKMIVHKFPNPIIIYPIADVHYGAIEHDKKSWESFCETVKNNPDVYLMLVGDLINNNIRSAVGNPFDEIVRPMQQKHDMIEYLKPIKDKILCAVSGNHEARTKKDSDIDITYDIMCNLDLEHLYRENAAFIKISLGTRKTCDKPISTYTFCVTHGNGGGIYTGATVNRNERYGNVMEGLDCLIVGHTHKGTVTRPSRIVVDARNNKVNILSYLVVSCESWMNYGGYAMRKMLLPSEASNPQKLYLAMDKYNKRIEVCW